VVTPETQFLDLVDLVAEPKKQLELLDLFVAKYPKYDGMTAVYSQMQEICVELKEFDRALSLGEKILATDEEDLPTIRLMARAAEGKGDQELTKKWRARLTQLEELVGNVSASSRVLTPYVEGPDDDPNTPGGASAGGAKTRLNELRAEASLFNRSLEERDPGKRLIMLREFEKQFPTSQHLGKTQYLTFVAYRDMPDRDKALTTAEAILQRDQTKEDVLYYVAEYYFSRKRNLDKVLTYSTLISDLVTGRPKPEGLTDEQWERQRKILLLNANFMMGMTYSYQEQWGAADKALRAALGLGRANDQITATILSNLGWANYKLKNIPESIRLYQQCMAISSPVQAAAAQSVASIKAEFNLQ
jgi:tetratricopeptide (TPR) repeat protein